MSENSRSDSLEQDRLHLLFKQARSASAIALLGAVACLSVMLHARPGPGPVIWFAAIAAATGLRFALYQRFFAADERSPDASHWLRLHFWTGGLIGVVWGSLPMVSMAGAPMYAQQLQTLVPGFLVMAAITSYGVYFSHYMFLLTTTGLTTTVSHLAARGAEGMPEVILYLVFAPVMAVTARRYCDSLITSMKAQRHSHHLVEKLTEANKDLVSQNTVMTQQRSLLEQEGDLAKHVFGQLILGGDCKLPGIHTWNQPMGSLSGDLTQTARGPSGQAYIFLSDFTGHGLPAALGALPASSVFLAMASKGLPVESIATELNTKLNQLLPIGYFCCAVLLELSADQRTLNVWNSGLPPVLVKRRDKAGYERIISHSLPLGVITGEAFDTPAQRVELRPGDLVYAYTDGLTEAANRDGEMWGTERLENFLERPDLPFPRLPALIEEVLQHIDRAPTSDDISIVEVEAGSVAAERADAA
jgi:serine phosphatase RsbU (regulator of sigma subunit)